MLTQSEFEKELEAQFDRLYRECQASRIVYEEAQTRFRNTSAKLYAVAAMLWGEKAQEFINGYPKDGKPQFQKGTQC
jgi:hypothetical protein